MPISKLLSESMKTQSVAVNESPVGCTTIFSSQHSDSFTSPLALFTHRRQDRDAGLMRHLSEPTVSLSLRTEKPLTLVTLLGVSTPHLPDNTTATVTACGGTAHYCRKGAICEERYVHTRFDQKHNFMLSQIDLPVIQIRLKSCGTLLSKWSTEPNKKPWCQK